MATANTISALRMLPLRASAKKTMAIEQKPLAPALPDISSAQILAQVDSILAQQGGAREWNQRSHAACIALVSKLCFPSATPAQRKQFLAALAVKGLGGNASQFRQWLEADGEGEPKRLAKSGKVISGYADLMG